MSRIPRHFLLFLSLTSAWPLPAADLTVSAATSLTDAFRGIAAAFEAGHPGTRVVLNFGASGLLLQQIDGGAPVDVLATADAETMDQAQARQLILGDSRLDFAGNSLVLIAPLDARVPLGSLADLARPGVGRIAISNPDSVPAGRYTRAVLEARGLWAAVLPKMISTQNVRQSLDYVVRGEVDAGFVYATDAALMRGKLNVVDTVETIRPIVYPIAVVRTSRQEESARVFVAFARSPPAQAILRTAGFRPH